MSRYLFLLRVEGDVMKIMDHLAPKQIDNIKKQVKKPKLKEWEIKELMGTNRDTYKRVNGAVRRR